MKTTTKLSLISSLGLAGSLVASSASASAITGANELSSYANVSQAGLGGNEIVNIVIYIVGLVSFVVLIFGIVKLIQDGNDLGLAGRAKTVIIYSLAGLIVTLLAFTINNCLVSESYNKNGRAESGQSSDGLFQGDSNADSNRGNNDYDSTTPNGDGSNSNNSPDDSTTSNNPDVDSGNLNLLPPPVKPSPGTTEPTPPQPDVPNPRYDI